MCTIFKFDLTTGLRLLLNSFNLLKCSMALDHIFHAQSHTYLSHDIFVRVVLFLICTNLSNDKLCACAVICVRSSIFFSLSSHIPSINLANYFIAFVRFKLNVLFLLLKVDKKSDRGAVAVVKWLARSVHNFEVLCSVRFLQPPIIF